MKPRSLYLLIEHLHDAANIKSLYKFETRN